MNRSEMIERLEEKGKIWDIIIIGGGATGLGAAVDATTRGYSVLLLEQHDFGKSTSGRSTKLIHGGVRYLQQGNISLVLEALQERGLLIRNAPHLVHDQAFIVPAYNWWSGPFYGIGLKVYDMMAGKLGLGPSSRLSREETLDRISTLEPQELQGGIVYYDGQFDDARLLINLSQTAAENGGIVINYMPVTGLIKSQDLIEGVVARDEETGNEYQIRGRAIINATGIFTDTLLKMDIPDNPGLMTLSQGIHIVLEREFLPGDTAIMVPHTSDGRVLFAIPWYRKVVIGTTETPLTEPTLEPIPQVQEIDFLLEHAAKYLSKDPDRGDILGIFAGIRPLVHSGETDTTAKISRDHFLFVSKSGLITITGGKWTTYRKMAEDTLDQARMVGGLPEKACRTRTLKIHGCCDETHDTSDPVASYGTDMEAIREIIRNRPALGNLIHPKLPYNQAMVIWAVRAEMARTVDDVLSRRTRSLLLDARASMDAAPQVAKLIAEELKHSTAWEQNQVKSFRKLAENYLP